MCSEIPRPVFVISEVKSFTTAFEFSKCPFGDDKGPIVVCGSNDGEISLYSLTTYRCLHRFKPDPLLDKRITSINPIESNLLIQFKTNEIFSVSQDGSRFITGKKWKSFLTSFSQCFVLDGKFISYLSAEDSICLTSLESSEITHIRLTAKEDVKHGVVMSFYLILLDVPQIVSSHEKQALYILITFEDGFFGLYRISLFEPLKQPILGSKELRAIQLSSARIHPEMVTCMDFCANVMCGISCSVTKEIFIWNLNLPEYLTKDDTDVKMAQKRMSEMYQSGVFGLVEKRQVTIRNEGILCCSIRGDGRIFATGGKDGRIRLFALRSGKPLAILTYHSNAIECVRFSSNQSKESSDYLLVAASRDKTISIWSLFNG